MNLIDWDFIELMRSSRKQSPFTLGFTEERRQEIIDSESNATWDNNEDILNNE